MASIQGKMQHPLTSTVTYITGNGAPTLVLNQVTPDGNREIPEIPVEGYICHPKENRYHGSYVVVS